MGAAAAMALLGSGCVSAYKPPTMAAPHAVLKLRRTYDSRAGTTLREEAFVDGHPAFHAQDSAETAQAARTDAILVHPRTAELRIATAFFHTEMRAVQETYSVQVPYTTTETYNCGSGTSYQTCTRMVTQSRTETRFRTVIRPVEVSDGSCAAALWIAPANGRAYLLEHEFVQNGLCRVACFEQTAGPEPGTFTNRPCPVPSPQDVQKALDDR